MANATPERLKDSAGAESIVLEGASHNIIGTLKDLNDPTATVTAVTTLLVEIYDEDSGDTLVAEEDANNANGHSFAAGLVTIEVDPSDNAIKHPENVARGCLEWHVCLVTWTWNDGNTTRTGKKEFRFPVKRLAATQ